MQLNTEDVFIAFNVLCIKLNKHIMILLLFDISKQNSWNKS